VELANYSTPLLILVSAFVVCMASAVFPFINTEAYVLFLSAVAPRHLLVPAVLIATLGHMIGKSSMFFAGRGLKRMSSERLQRKLVEVTQRLERWRGSSSLLMFASAVGGIPPFYVVSVAAGALRLNFAAFFVAGYLGRLIRFALVAGIPQLVREVVT
jgi:membrane protein YqaA with SNARE-associated domain